MPASERRTCSIMVRAFAALLVWLTVARPFLVIPRMSRALKKPHSCFFACLSPSRPCQSPNCRGKEGAVNHAQHDSLHITSPCRLTPGATNSKRPHLAELPDTRRCLKPVSTSPLLMRRVRDHSFRLPVCCTLALPDPLTHAYSFTPLSPSIPSSLPPPSPPSLSMNGKLCIADPP